MKNIIVAGIGTDVGKTVVSAILVEALEADYWKPLQTGPKDTDTVRLLTNNKSCTIFPANYSLLAPLSPHMAARKEGIFIDPVSIIPPPTEKTLIIEGVGGILVPFTEEENSFALFSKWDAAWLLVSRHYLGSINHTLLTLAFLQQKKVPLLGVIFNGEENPEIENAILKMGNTQFLERVLPENTIDRKTIQHYSEKWKKNPHFFKKIANLSGIPLHK